MEMIDVLISANNNRIMTIENSKQAKSNKLIYVFIGGILLEKIYTFLYDLIMHTEVSSVNVIDVVTATLIIVLYTIIVCVLAKYIYSSYFELFDFHANEIDNLNEFNCYLLDKKLDILSNASSTA